MIGIHIDNLNNSMFAMVDDFKKGLNGVEGHWLTTQSQSLVHVNDR